MQAIFETLFDIAYLVTVILLGIWMLRDSRGRRQYLLYGIMAVTLGCGDAFHLIPRAVALCTTGLEHCTAALGIGKLVTSIIGVPLTAVMLLVRGVTQVLGLDLTVSASAALSGIAGIGHVLTGIGIILLLVSLKKMAGNGR